jgi:hypothetical protein
LPGLVRPVRTYWIWCIIFITCSRDTHFLHWGNHLCRSNCILGFRTHELIDLLGFQDHQFILHKMESYTITLIDKIVQSWAMSL